MAGMYVSLLPPVLEYREQEALNPVGIGTLREETRKFH
jgi:hypothetical protein